MTRQSKTAFFITTFLNEYGVSDILERYSLHKDIAYTSGDGIFRSDATLGRKYKFFRFSRKINFINKKSRCWILTDEDKTMLNKIHSTLTFKTKGNTVEYIKFFGMADEEIIDKGIRADIRNTICQNSCVNCGRSDDIQCDHKNDLKNDPRVLIKKTQTFDDFQALCRSCNDKKRNALQYTKKNRVRYGASKIILGWMVDFTIGDETLDFDDPNWYKGTYWGDCVAFRKAFVLKT